MLGSQVHLTGVVDLKVAVVLLHLPGLLRVPEDLNAGDGIQRDDLLGLLGITLLGLVSYEHALVGVEDEETLLESEEDWLGFLKKAF